MSAWEDATSYQRGQERTPRAWSVRGDGWEIGVGNYHVHYREDPHWHRWLRIRTLEPISRVRVNEMTEVEFKRHARRCFARELRRIADELDQITEEVPRG